MGTEKIICDTDVLIDYLNSKNKRHQPTVELIENEIGLKNVLISAITKIELISGAQNKQELQRIERQINRFNILTIDSQVTDISTVLVYKYNLSHGLAIPDAFSAATAIYLNYQLYTYNLRDFKFIENLKLYKY